MKFSEHWLREWVNPDVDSQALAEQLTMLGLEVDSIEPAAAKFTGVVVGEVISAEPHPDADRLRCCKVNVGEKNPLDIVCGGINVRAGLRVAVATVGAILPGDFKIKKAKLRGMPSHGMICSSSELGLGEGEKGAILELREDASIGSDFRHYLNLDDHIIDIELTANRGDCACIRGIAREVAVINRVPMKAHDIAVQNSHIQDQFPIVVKASSACPRYVGRLIRGINSKALIPLWMEERLRRSDIRIVHPVVDILNYVMLEIGQPMHVFDLDHLTNSIIVRYPNKGESLKLLGNKEVHLSEDSLIIADEKKPLAIAGVMGGMDSAVNELTQNIFLESAFFDSIAVRHSAKIYGLQTDSSYRFERGVDYALQVAAIERATELLLSIVGGEAAPVQHCVSESDLPKQKIITFHSQEIYRLLGITLEDTEIERILITLGMEVRPALKGWVIAVPSYRYDLENEADLVEEIARIYGYDNIPSTSMSCRESMLIHSEAYLARSRIAEYLVDRGYNEAITYSFISKELYFLFDPTADALMISNPIASDLAVMRNSLWPGLIRAVQYNQHRQLPRVRLFEMGLSFISEDSECEQIEKLAIVAAGNAYPEQWGLQKRSIDFYDLKGEIDNLLQQTGCASLFSWGSAEHPALHPGQTAILYRDDQPVGYLGVLHPNLVEQFELQPGICCFEVNLSAIQVGETPHYEKISKFPGVRRDLALIIDENVSIAKIKELIAKNSGQLLNSVEIFDIYQGEGIEKGKKSVALGLTFQDPSRTLVDAEINEVIQDVVANLERNFNAKLRA